MVNTATVRASGPDTNPNNNQASFGLSTPQCTITGRGNITGTAGDDVICGSAGSDVIKGKDGNDIDFGLGGGDLIDGQHGNDLLVGGEGPDHLLGQTGDDYLEEGPEMTLWREAMVRTGYLVGTGTNSYWVTVAMTSSPAVQASIPAWAEGGADQCSDTEIGLC